MLAEDHCGCGLEPELGICLDKGGSTRRGFQFVSDTCSNYHLDPQAASQIKLLLPYLTGRGGQ